MKVVVDYRPALRARSGVGEYVHHAARAYAAQYSDDDLTLFTSSWKDRPDPTLTTADGVLVSDHRIPVAVLNFAWHRLGWPSIEQLTGGTFDVAFSPHPLLMPARAAAQVIMIHDLDFLHHPERTVREIRRDYPSLVRGHAAQAARVVVPSAYTANQVASEIGVPREHIAVCAPGAPEWLAGAAHAPRSSEYLLFVGTLEPRKNIERLLEAYRRLIGRRADVPRLVIAGRSGPDAEKVRAAIATPPLQGRVEFRGFVADAERPRLFAAARALVLPSLEEGFGLPALEAMTLGVPVVVSNRGALPELVGDAGLIVDPEDVEALSVALEQVLTDRERAASLGRRGVERSRAYGWTETARALRQAFQDALAAARRKTA